MSRTLLLVLGTLLASLGPLNAAGDGDAAGVEFFEKKIRPVLVDRCYACHSAKAEKLKGALRVDSRAGLLRGGSQGAAIHPGDPDASLLVKAIRYVDPDLRMPPKGRLPVDVVRDFEAWVRAGAVDPRVDAAAPDVAKAPHWAFQPLANTHAPSEGPLHPIDAFLEGALRAKGLAPASPADKATLLRRATYDLVGLPPTPEELDAFVADTSPDAFAKVVDRLLASPRYGERYGRHWLDLVRYTDDLDEAWRYRDWVIRSFNDDLSYDRFVIDQIAGDRLPPPEPGGVWADGIVATTFLSLGTWGGIDRKKRLLDVVDDQIDTIGRTFLGLTLACARCHDHKFDPVSSQDYYGLAGIFLSSRVMSDAAYLSHGAHVLRVPLVPAEQVRKAEEHQARVRALQQRLDVAVQEAYRAFAAGLLERTADYLLAAKEGKAPKDLQDFALKQWKKLLDAPSPRPGRLLARAVKNYDDEAGVHAWMGSAERPWWGVNTTDREIPIETFALPARSVVMYPSVEATAVVWQSPIAGRIRIRGRLTDLDPLDGVGVTWTCDHERGDGSREAAFGSVPNGGASDIDADPMDVQIGDRIRLAIALSKGDAHYDATSVQLTVTWADGAEEWDLTRNVEDSFLAGNPQGVWSFWDMAGSHRSNRMPSMEPLLATFKKTPTREAAEQVQRAALADESIVRELSGPHGPFGVRERDDARYLSAELRAPIEKLTRQLETLKSQAPPLPCAHGVQEGGLKYSLYPGFQSVSVHVRGNPDRFGPPAPRGFPRALGGDAIRGPDGSGRLELARWIASPFHPLTARVLVNRIWQHHFGEGLVRTPSNFGTRGEAPTHPELLDFLARRFLESGQSLKAMHRFIMTSAAYQRSSRATTDMVRADPENRLLARMNRRRLEAESLRDGVLAVAGNLDLKAGGPADKNSGVRRMVYLRLSRSERSGFATLFDGANPALHVEQRPVSTIAPQALYLMNASFVLDQAKALAARTSGAGDAGSRIDRLYRLAYGRGATAEERALARAFVESGPPSPWELLAQAVLLSNEFVFVD